MSKENPYSFIIPEPPKTWLGRLLKKYRRRNIIGSPGSGKKINIYDSLFEKYGREKALEIIKGANSIFEPKSK